MALKFAIAGASDGWLAGRNTFCHVAAGDVSKRGHCQDANLFEHRGYLLVPGSIETQEHERSKLACTDDVVLAGSNHQRSKEYLTRR